MQVFQDWEPVGWNKVGEKRREQTKTMYLNDQMRKNNTTSLKKNVSNKNQVEATIDSRKLEKEEETFKHTTISSSVSKRIAKARCDKKMTQKELANALYLPFKIIQDYEAGKAIPNHLVLNKIEKILGKVRD